MAGTGPTAGLFVELEGHLIGRDDVVAALAGPMTGWRIRCLRTHCAPLPLGLARWPARRAGAPARHNFPRGIT